MAELVFEVVQEPDGAYCAECLTENIFTLGDTWEELRRNVVEATNAFFFDGRRPELVRLHLVRDEILSEPFHQRIVVPDDDPLRLGTFPFDSAIGCQA